MDLINNEIAKMDGNPKYQISTGENRPHIELINFFYDQAEQYSFDTEFWFQLVLASPLPKQFGQKIVNVDPLFQATNQFYNNLVNQNQAQLKQVEIEKLEKKAPSSWKVTVKKLFDKLLLRETVNESKLNNGIVDHIIDQIHQTTQLNKKLVESEIGSIIRINLLKHDDSLAQYRRKIAAAKVTRAVLLAATASGTLSAQNTYEHGYVEIVGLKENIQEKHLHQDDIVRFLGRNSETCYQFEPEVIIKLKECVVAWCQGPTRILVLDITIEKRNDELMEFVNSEIIQQLIAQGKLRVIIFKSEQKQQSLGSGKFSAGSACLIAKQI